MTVERLKSHTLRRDEKGLFGVPFKRLLAAAMAGGISLSLTQNVLGQTIALPLALVGALAALVFTASRGGIPLWHRLIYAVRARLLLLALGNPQLKQVFPTATDELNLDAGQLFKAPPLGVTKPTDWALYRDPSEKTPALALLDKPVEG